MVATSFEIRPETRFDERVIKPSVIGDLENFSAAILERQSQEKELFKPGLHVCSSCAAVVLTEMRDSEAWRFRDRSVLEQCDREGHSDRVEGGQAILHKNRLISDGKVHPKIATRFVACSDKHLKAPDGRRASYRHLPGHGENCRADTEHERITDRLRSVFTNELKALYPDCDITDQLNLKASDDLSQRPDIKFTIKGDTPSGPVDFAIAVEVQQSKIAFDAWENRNQGLLTVATPVVWVFKKTRSSGSFKPILTSMVEGDLPAWVYHIEGEPGSDDGNLILTPAKDGYPDFWGGFDTPNQPKENPVCQNAYHRRRKEIAETYRVGVSGRSEVTLIGGLAQLKSILPGLATPQSVQADLSVQVDLAVDPGKQESLPEVRSRISHSDFKLDPRDPGVGGKILGTPLYYPKRTGKGALFVASLEVDQFLGSTPRSELLAELLSEKVLLWHSKHLGSDEILEAFTDKQRELLAKARVVVRLKAYGSLAEMVGAHVFEGYRVQVWGRLGWDSHDPNKLCIEPNGPQILVADNKKGSFWQLEYLVNLKSAQPNHKL